jgi:hypothetical protein
LKAIITLPNFRLLPVHGHFAGNMNGVVMTVTINPACQMLCHALGQGQVNNGDHYFLKVLAITGFMSDN